MKTITDAVGVLVMFVIGHVVDEHFVINMFSLHGSSCNTGSFATKADRAKTNA